ncbi:MAG TPA: hypothetical protein PLJ94_07790 [Methylotenera sp.]|nr:hypothetical protein [Methylotenera sp.]HPH08563.1 hypothetical protein [Methylotenera sp.]HPM48697.1 hypothetical protein [Methylotenera sp.]
MAIHTNTSPHFLRLKQIIGDKKANPPIQAIIPVSKSTWWAGVKSGKFPAPQKLGLRTTVWLSTDVYALLVKPE